MQMETRWLLFSTMTFFTGLVLGLSTGVLCAPQSGIRARQKLKNMAEDAAERVEGWADETKQTMSDMVKRGRTLSSAVSPPLSKVPSPQIVCREVK